MCAGSPSIPALKNRSPLYVVIRLRKGCGTGCENLMASILVSQSPFFTSGGGSTSLIEQANTLGWHFDQVSSSANYTKSFLRQKRDAERATINTFGGLREQ